MSDRKLLDGKSALVTGAASGIGRAIVKALVGAGAWVAVTDKNGSAAAALAKEIGADAIAAELDVTDAAATARVFEQAEAAFGRIDVVCANAGISTMNPTVELTEAEWDANMDVNAKGVFLTNQAAVRRWIATGHKGVIVNTASLAGKLGAPLLAHYSASKFAVVGFTQALAREMGPHGIRVNCVCPGFVKTSMQEREVDWEAKLRGMTAEAVLQEYVSLTPLGRLQEAGDVADIVLFLASDLSRFLTGEAINASGGVTMD
jgi:meso-butanediol dehydrogenase / (S,S)-butanediol dehydrogenase / diacetyl reductase